MRKWVRYEAPIMVCVELDDTAPDGGRVINVVLGTEPEDITLARDFRGHFLVYDQQMRAQYDERTDQRAITIAEYREWPDRPDWEEGPDALRYPGLYDPDEPDQDDEDDLQLVDLDEDPTAAETTGRRQPAS